MTQDELKQAVARAALDYVVDGEIIGVGTGSTANFFIDALGPVKHRIRGAVASSDATAARLRGHGIEVFDLNAVERMAVYIDGADEITASGAMIKGGGAALTREKIVASVAQQFICIADGSKLVKTLGAFALPVEVISVVVVLVVVVVVVQSSQTAVPSNPQGSGTYTALPFKLQFNITVVVVVVVGEGIIVTAIASKSHPSFNPE